MKKVMFVSMVILLGYLIFKSLSKVKNDDKRLKNGVNINEIKYNDQKEIKKAENLLQTSSCELNSVDEKFKRRKKQRSLQIPIQNYHNKINLLPIIEVSENLNPELSQLMLHYFDLSKCTKSLNPTIKLKTIYSKIYKSFIDDCISKMKIASSITLKFINTDLYWLGIKSREISNFLDGDLHYSLGKVRILENVCKILISQFDKHILKFKSEFCRTDFIFLQNLKNNLKTVLFCTLKFLTNQLDIKLGDLIFLHFVCLQKNLFEKTIQDFQILIGHLKNEDYEDSDLKFHVEMIEYHFIRFIK